jgi:hypothetical protein
MPHSRFGDFVNDRSRLQLCPSNRDFSRPLLGTALTDPTRPEAVTGKQPVWSYHFMATSQLGLPQRRI